MKMGCFTLVGLQKKNSDGSIILPKDAVVEVSHYGETNIDIDLNSEAEWEKFWRTHTVSHYIIKNGFNVKDKL